jgi:hypothetical protein
LCAFTPVVRAQDASLLSKFVSQTSTGGDKQLGSLASLLSDKVKAFGAALGDNDAVKGKLDGMVKSLIGAKDSDALNSAFGLVKEAKLTAPQMDLAKQVGNVASAFVVQRNFASLEGGQTDVANVVNALKDGKLTSAVSPLKNIAGNAHLTDPQKQLAGTLTDKYCPGLKKAAGALDGVKKIGGF